MSDVVDAAEAHYRAHDWAAALAAFRTVAAADPAAALRAALPIAIGHCLIELADGDPADLAPCAGQPVAPDAQAQRAGDLRVRAVGLARAGDFARASRLLRFLSGYDGLLARVYAEGLLAGRSPCCAIPDAPAAAAAPPFLADLGVTEATVASQRARAAGKRLLIVARQAFAGNPARQHEFHDNVGRSAHDFGMAVSRFDSHFAQAPAAFASALQEAIIGCRPDLIYVDDLFESGLSAAPGMEEQVALVLQSAREVLGARVIKCFPDAWMVPPDRICRGLGGAVDLVHHMHPTILARASAAERAATWCYPFPYRLPAPTGPAGTVPRAAFAGSVHHGSVPRLFWWAEIGRRGLPFDFHETDHGSATQRSDQDYVDLLRHYQISVSLTRRTSGVAILCGRTIETPLAGGCLLEEDSSDTRYFLTPGVHYLPFQSLDDLDVLIPRLLRDHGYRARLAAAGQAWVTRYFTGDWFWAGLLARLDAQALVA